MPETKPKSGVGSLVVRPLLAGMVAAGAVAPVAVPAAESIFLKLEGVKGESTDSKHKDEIVILSYTQSWSNGGGTTRVNCNDVRVSKIIDKSSTALIMGVVTNKHFPTAVITFRTAGKTQLEYYKVTLTEVLLTSITQNDVSPTDATSILEQVTMSAAKFKFEYRPQNPDGSPGAAVTFTYDCAGGKGT